MTHGCLITIAVILLTAACNCRHCNTKVMPTRQEYLASLDSAARDKSLVFWIEDSAYNANPELLLLLDTLYQHKLAWTESTTEDDVRKEETWATAYRRQLCAYHDRHAGGNDAISEYAKADSVLNEGIRLIRLADTYSTMGNIEHILNRCKEYGQLSRLVNACEDTTTRRLLYEEFASFARLNSMADKIATNIVVLRFWGGSISGPISWSCTLAMQETRMKAYGKLTDFVLDDNWDTAGPFPASAKTLYLDCVSTSLKKNSDYHPDGNPELYDEKKKETAENIRRIPLLIDEWSRTVAQLDNVLTHDVSAHIIERYAASILVAFAEEATMY